MEEAGPEAVDALEIFGNRVGPEVVGREDELVEQRPDDVPPPAVGAWKGFAAQARAPVAEPVARALPLPGQRCKLARGAIAIDQEAEGNAGRSARGGDLATVPEIRIDEIRETRPHDLLGEERHEREVGDAPDVLGPESALAERLAIVGHSRGGVRHQVAHAGILPGPESLRGPALALAQESPPAPEAGSVEKRAGQRCEGPFDRGAKSGRHATEQTTGFDRQPHGVRRPAGAVPP